ncbi:MAG: hypothetical protein LKE37_05945 [Atopobiaceae bacterium]|jgi:hypothetical protein|nr:hypothetical protein [Atopobiaceae bacterium]
MSRVASFGLRAVAVACRILAIALAADVVALCLAIGPTRTPVMMATNALSQLVVAPLSGSFVIQTSLDGAFRGDFALASLALFVIDWLCSRAAARSARSKGPTPRYGVSERSTR